MSPPTQVLTKEEAERKFQKSRPRDCKLRKISQYECVLTPNLEIECRPFERIFKECTVETLEKKTKKKVSTRRLFEITSKTTNVPVETEVAEIRNLLRSIAQFEDFAKKN